MSLPSMSPPALLAQRRREVLTRTEMQRATIGEAWTDFGHAAARGETRARHAIIWTRRVAGIVAIVGAWRTLRGSARMRVSFVGRAMRTMAALQVVSRRLGLIAKWGSR